MAIVVLGYGVFLGAGLLLAAGLTWEMALAVGVAVVGLALLAVREVTSGWAVTGLIAGGFLVGALCLVGPFLPSCLQPVSSWDPIFYCAVETAHPAMRLGAMVGGLLGASLLPLVLWSRRSQPRSLDAADPRRIVLGTWLGGLAVAHLWSISGFWGWIGLLVATALILVPVCAAWQGVRWLRSVYAGTREDWWIDADCRGGPLLPLLVSGQAPHRSDAVLMRSGVVGAPYRSAAGPRPVAFVCSSLELQLRPLRRRVWLGALVLTALAGAGTWAQVRDVRPEEARNAIDPRTVLFPEP